MANVKNKSLLFWFNISNKEIIGNIAFNAKQLNKLA
jgi:hypothetical protein